MRRAAILLAAFVVVARGRVAHADPPETDAERRAAIEASFLEERFDDVRALATEGDAEALLLLRAFWRPDGTPTPRVHGRLEWLLRGEWVPYPQPVPDEPDPFPRLTALVRDRTRREQMGAKGLPDASPLAEIDDPDVREFLQRDMRPAFLGPDPALRTDAEKALEGRVRDVASRNLAVALGAVLGLLAAAGAWLLATRPRRGAGGGG